mgnify:FL=1
MALSYKGYRINLKPLRSSSIHDTTIEWQLELERGNFICSRLVGREMTIKQVEDYAFNEIDKLIEEEKKS